MPTAGAWWDDQSRCTRSLSEQAAKRSSKMGASRSAAGSGWGSSAPSEPSRNEPPTPQPSSAARCSVYAGSRNLPFSMRNASFTPLICNCAGVCTAVQIQGGDQVVMVVCLPLSHQAPLPERGAGAVRLQEHGSTRSRTTCSRLSRTT